MPFSRIEPGSSIETLNKAELDDALQNQANIFLHEAAVGIKYIQVTLLQGSVNNTVINIDGSSSSGTSAGPRSGYIWTMTRMSVSGLAIGSNPDVVNLYRFNKNGVPLWQFNGNNFGYTFGKMQMVLLPGTYLTLYGTNITATGQVTLTADVIEAPAEMLYKIV
jgi:hypothetical protein